MNYKINYITDIFDNNYIGIQIQKDAITPYLNDMKDILGDDDYKLYISNQQNRDDKGDLFYSHHITLVNVFTMNTLMSSPNSTKYIEYLDSVINTIDITDIKFKGIGMAKRNENIAFFVVVESDMLHEFQSRLGIEPTDLHITIGFNNKDVFGVSKSNILELKSKLKSKIEYLKSKHDGISFIFDIDNLDDNLKDINDTIKEVSLNDTVYKVEIKNTILGISLINDELRIVYQFNKE